MSHETTEQELAASERAVRRQTDILQAVLHGMSDGVVVANEQGRFLLFNQAAEQILGAGGTEINSAEFAERYGLYLPDMVTPFPVKDLPLSRAIRGERVNEVEVFVRHANKPEGVWLSVNARPLRDETGLLRGGIVVFRDISGRKRSERRLAAQYAVTRVLAAAATLGEATPRMLQAICESMAWDMGAIWSVDRQTEVLRCVDVWHRPDSNLAEFERLNVTMTFPLHVGLPGRVWASKEPAWIMDFTQDRNFPRAATAAEYGLRGAFAFPILFARQVIGVIEFFSRDIRSPDDDLLSMLSTLGMQIGQFTERRRAEEESRKSSERFELAMLGSRDGIWDWDVATDSVHYSSRWKGMLGYEDHEISNHFDEWEERLHPDDRDRALRTIRDYLSGQKPVYELEHRLRHKDGSYRWILARGVALRDAAGKPYRMAGSHTDITERKQAEEALRNSEALYQSLVESLPLNVFRKNLEGRFTFANHLFCQSVGRPPEQIVGKTDFDFYPTALAEKYRQDDRRCIEQEEILDEVEEHHRPGGEKIYVQVLKTPVYDSKGEIVGMQGIFWDISDRKRAEEEMRKAKEEAESANRAKSVFLASMSHEIRTPMNAIIGMTELVLGTELNAEQREYLELVKKSADSLLSVINAVLDFSKVEAGKLELDTIRFNLRDHLGDTLNTLAPQAHQKRLELACHVATDVPDALWGDPLRLGQILVNLVGNALKFTEQGEVVVDVQQTARAEKEVWLHFVVADTGIGIPGGKQKLIFDPFAQADGSSTRKYAGTGLGLAITKRLVELMHGSLWVESTVGRGSTFHFTARFAVQEDAALGGGLSTPPVEAATMRGMPVLVVDDNSTNRRILEEMLAHWQMRPVAVDGGPAALAALTEAARAGEPFPLVLLDVNMPDMDGYELAQRIKEQPELAGVTLILLTSGGPPGDGNRRRDLGINYCLTKPIKQADLWRIIMQALGMPLAAEGPSSLPAALRSLSKNRLRVLLAEDNLVNQKLAVRLLERRGHQVVVANNGREVLAALQRQPIDVVLMDVQMPEMDGFEATAAIRRQEEGTGRHLPIIAMTAYALKGDRERCLAAGMDRYLSKPIRARELFDSVEAVAARRERQPKENAIRVGEVLDLATALARVGEDRELLQELAELFLQECPRLMQRVRAALADQDPLQLKCAAHSLKGSIDSFAAKDAYDAALALEISGRNGNLVGAREACAVLEKEVKRLTEALDSFAKESR
jgi:PAS domain S-box-containing protein